MLVRVFDVTYVETQFNNLKLCKLISPRETKSSFSIKLTENMQRKPEKKYFVQSQV